MFFSLFSLPVVLSLLVTSVSALATPLQALNARDTSLAARHRHIARRASGHPVARRWARRKRCLEKTTLASASPSSSSAPVTTTSSNSVPDLPANVAHQPTTTTETPAPVTPYTPPQSTTAAAAPTTGTGSGESRSGDGTYFDVGLGACGQYSTNTDYMVAIGWELFDSFGTPDSAGNPNKNPVCNKRIRATYGGKSVDVVVLDRCGGCKPNDLDFSPTAFNQLADFSIGRLREVQWQFI